jgi:predicted DsbA family dithiol-disulfide isomerase
MAPEVEKLKDIGFQVEARQVDAAPLATFFQKAITEDHATADELQRHGIQSVPVLLIADLKSRAVYRVAGYQSAESVVQTINGKP